MSASHEPNEGTAVIVVGIDPHKKSHTAVAVEATTGQVIDELTVAASDRGHARLVRWVIGLGEQVRVALEDVRHVSGRLERALIEQQVAVVRVPPRLMGQARRQGRARGKSDPIDAAAVARAALAHPDLPAAALAGPELDLHLLLSHREDLVAERTKLQGRLRWHLHALDPGIEVPPRALGHRVWLDRISERLGRMNGMRARIAAELADDCRALSTRIDALEREIAGMAETQAPELVAIPGCGPLTAAKLVAEVAGIERFEHPAKLARYAGVAPVPVSSGMRQRHRLDRTGNRQLNCALHRIAITQARVYLPAQDYLARRVSEGKTPREARRCLKRHLVNVIFKAMNASQRATSTSERPPLAAALT
jgi:transposase